MKKNTFALKGPKGVTLIELTVVIAIILVLISVLFVGANYYRTNANTAACIVNITNMHKAGRSVQNITNAAPTALTDFIGTGLPITATPACPASGTYAFGSAAVGSSLVTCNVTGHAPANTAGW